VKIESQGHNSVTVVVPHGPLIGEESLDLQRAVDTAFTSGARRVVLDLADVPYLDSGGIELLLEIGNVTRAPQQRPTLAAVTETCMEALELTDVLPRLEVFDTVENALRSCQR
jgi:stage II sporulation protein AA (anti-sigma F factor antagonist)